MRGVAVTYMKGAFCCFYGILEFRVVLVMVKLCYSIVVSDNLRRGDAL